ncbi:4910_t:CDS:2, partial [Acaulospora colombiana]
PIVRQLDYAWRASHPSSDLGGEPENRLYSVSRKDSYNALMLHEADEDALNVQSTPGVQHDAERNDSSSAYEWNMRDWSNQFGHYLDPKSSGRLARGASARKNPNAPYPTDPNERGDPDFDWVLGYRTKLLAESIFRFDRNLCNQRFELILEDLLFLGHPVCIGDDGTWQWEQLYADPKTKTDSNDPNADESTEVNNTGKSQSKDLKNEASLKYFHLVLVLDRPDAALGGSVNLTRFIDVYYEQIAVKMTAALHYEQSRTGYVEKETDLLVDLMDAETYDEFERTALERSSLARAIRDIFVAVQNQRLAHVNVGAFELDLQMPWYHAELLTGEDDPEGA